MALALAIFVLPSALNLPLANPGQTLEYAPVPGNQGSQVGGNFAGLGLGEGEGPAGFGGSRPAGGLSQLPPGTGDKPSTKRCVGTPPRQTEDPLSPPCVAFFNGDNGGSTYQGVTAGEIRVVFYSDSGLSGNGCNSKNPPASTYYDLWNPQAPDENTCWSTLLRIWQKYFNDRFQTYNRRVHFFLYFGETGTVQDLSVHGCGV